MSKFNIGVGDEFPLDEGQPEGRGRGHRGRHHHEHHGHPHHHHHRGILHLPLFVGIAAIAALIGAGKIPHLATEAILVLAAILVVLAIAGHFWAHRRWHADRNAQ